MNSNAFRTAVETHDMDAAVEQLADDVTFSSPVVFKPYEGKAVVSVILQAVGRVFEDFSYESEVSDGDRTVLVFNARVGDKSVQGADHLRFNEEGLIQELTVMVRPMSGMHALAEAMKAQLEAAGVI
jgi:limonene-1,2-epoxide hydrolase